MLCEAKHSYDFSDNEVRVNLYGLIHLYKYNWYLGVYKGREIEQKRHIALGFFSCIYSTYIARIKHYIQHI